MIISERRDNMELVKSKGMLVFFIVVLLVTIISSINTKKYDESRRNIEDNYISMNLN